MVRRVLPIFGFLGAFGWVYIYAKSPSFPTPDKLLILAVFIGMVFGQAWELTKRLVPFIALMAVYDLFRGFADYLNNNVNYMFMPAVDRLMFAGVLPTLELQKYLWNGQVQWYDFLMYLMYMMHYVIVIVLAIVIWKIREQHYWRYVMTFVAMSFAGFLTFLAFPAAPPWMSSDMGLIEPVRRISSDVWFALGVQDFPSMYNQISPNAVAAVPSLHAAYATLVCLFIFQLFKGKWRYFTLIYPASIYFGTVYFAEHYVFDEIVGALLGVAAFKASFPMWRFVRKRVRRVQALQLRRRLAYVFINANDE